VPRLSPRLSGVNKLGEQLLSQHLRGAEEEEEGMKEPGGLRARLARAGSRS
jgi:hypothetical protein